MLKIIEEEGQIEIKKTKVKKKKKTNSSYL